MHGTCSRLDLEFSPPSLNLSSLLAPAVPTALVVSTTFFLVLVTGVEVAKTDTSFLTFFSNFGDNYSNNAPSYGRCNI